MKKYIAIVVFLIVFVASFNFALAARPGEESSSVTFTNPLGNIETAQGFLGRITTELNNVFIAIAIIVIIIGGIMYMLSFGNEKSMEKAKNVIVAAAIGLAIALSAKTILQTIWDALGLGGPSPGGASFQTVSGNILTFLLSIVGIIAIISLIIGGIMYLTSYGDEDRVSKGKKIILASIIGIAFSIGSVVLVKQIGGLLGYSF